jgi:8-oxo-dGTP diphosphatase
MVTEVAVAVAFRRVAAAVDRAPTLGGAAPRPAAGAVEILIARRHRDAVRGGLWEYPGGKVEPGERPSQAALRELAEEAGVGAGSLRGEPVELAVAAHTDPTERREKSVRIHAFLIEVDPGCEPRALGSAEVRWARLESLDDYAWPPANAALHEALRKWFAR